MLRKSSLRKVSKKHAARLREYRKIRDRTFATHPFCEIPDCFNQAVDVHHINKRGKNLSNTRDWLLVCRFCHDKIHQNPKWAREKGYLK